MLVAIVHVAGWWLMSVGVIGIHVLVDEEAYIDKIDFVIMVASSGLSSQSQ